LYVIFQDEKYIAFNDIKPASENHFLVIPKEHIDNTKSLSLNQVYIGKVAMSIYSPVKS